MHIDECLEAVLFAAVEEPIDRTLLIDFQVIGIEVVDEVAAYHFTRRTLAAESVSDELEVFFQSFAAIDGFYPLHKAAGNVIIYVNAVFDTREIPNKQGLSAVLLRRKPSFLCPFSVGCRFPCVILNQAVEPTQGKIKRYRNNQNV